MTNQTTDQLAEKWLELKKTEQSINRDRVKVEKELIAALHFEQLEGSKSESSEAFKVTMTAKLNRKLDTKAWESIKDSIPVNMRPVEESIAYKVIDRGCRYIEQNEPDIWAKIAKALTVTPAKTAVKVERV